MERAAHRERKNEGGKASTLQMAFTAEEIKQDIVVPIFSILVHMTVVARSIKRVTEKQRDKKEQNNTKNHLRLQQTEQNTSPFVEVPWSEEAIQGNF